MKNNIVDVNKKKINKLEKENKKLKSIVKYLWTFIELKVSIEEMEQAGVDYNVDIDFSIDY